MAKRTTIGTTSGPTRVEVDRVDLAAGELRAAIVALGARIDRLEAPDRDGTLAELTLGFDTVDGHEVDRWMGATIGRFANRIGDASITIDGTTHRLAANEGANVLHGGNGGFSTQVWDVEASDDEASCSLVSPAGDMGFPGRVDATAHYRLLPDRLTITFTAATDEATVVSMTNHAYWNLGGPHRPTIDDHVLTIDADHWLPVDDSLIPLGHDEPAADGMDFTDGRSLDGVHLDHCFVVTGDGLRRHARLDDPGSGRWMEVWSDHPTCQVYTGDKLTDRSDGRRPIGPRAALAIEPQHRPRRSDGPWPAPILRPGETYRHRIELRFGTT